MEKKMETIGIIGLYGDSQGASRTLFWGACRVRRR